MFYQGKAQSFSSLASVESIGDLPKNLVKNQTINSLFSDIIVKLLTGI